MKFTASLRGEFRLLVGFLQKFFEAGAQGVKFWQTLAASATFCRDYDGGPPGWGLFRENEVPCVVWEFGTPWLSMINDEKTKIPYRRCVY